MLQMHDACVQIWCCKKKKKTAGCSKGTQVTDVPATLIQTYCKRKETAETNKLGSIEKGK